MKQILTEYEVQLEDTPLGKRFDECYDLEKLQPTQRHVDLYERCKDKLPRFGLEYSQL